MEIGGYDTFIKTDNPHKIADEIIEWLDWQNAVTEMDGEDFFYYQDTAAAMSWSKDCPVEEMNNMVYFLFDSGQLTIVTDKELTDKIRNFI